MNPKVATCIEISVTPLTMITPGVAVFWPALLRTIRSRFLLLYLSLWDISSLALFMTLVLMHLAIPSLELLSLMCSRCLQCYHRAAFQLSHLRILEVVQHRWCSRGIRSKRKSTNRTSMKTLLMATSRKPPSPSSILLIPRFGKPTFALWEVRQRGLLPVDPHHSLIGSPKKRMRCGTR